MRKIGFNETYTKETVAPAAPENLLLEFDSGRGITFDSSLRHLLVTGTTGSGKTRSVMLPILKRHIESGNCGFVVDVKGNLRGMIREIAEDCGRGDDVVEFGTSETATPVNLLSNMDAPQFYDFCIELMRDNFFGETNNMDFHVRGARIAKECFQMLKWLGARHPVLAPNLLTILELFSDFKRATALFQHFASDIADRNDEEQMEFVKGVKNSQFHVLNQLWEKSGNIEQAQQMSFCTDQLITALKGFVDVPGMANFCAQGAAGIDMDELVRQKKIVALRCDPQSGMTGAHIGRHMLNQFYKAIFEEGIRQRDHQRFVFIDEFQEVADLGGGRFSDVNFIAQAREFGVGFMAATQSASALMNRGNSRVAVEAFASNCNSKIMFFTDDEQTRAIAARYSTTDLIDLKPGQAFVINYDSDTRKHEWGVETFSKAYGLTAGLRGEASVSVKTGHAERIRLAKAMADLKIRDIPYSPRERPKKEESEPVDSNPIRDEFLREFPFLFSETSNIRIPPGWKKAAKEALVFFEGLNLGIVIDSLAMGERQTLYACACHRQLHEFKMLNKVLVGTKYLCMYCGARLEDKDEEGEDDQPDYFSDCGDDEPFNVFELPICDKCKAELSERTWNSRRSLALSSESVD